MIKFEKISKYENEDLVMPARGTAQSAGYDLAAAEDIVIPSCWGLLASLSDACADGTEIPISLQDLADLTKKSGARPTLVPTGMKCQMEDNMYLELSVRSSSPLKYWLLLANGVGIIDKDYYNNPDNEGHIFLQVINLSPFDIIIHKNEKIGQAILKSYLTTTDDQAEGERAGGFGSTTKS